MEKYKKMLDIVADRRGSLKTRWKHSIDKMGKLSHGSMIKEM
jgi:hypothetical protein